MKAFRKILTAVFAACIAFSVAGCASTGKENTEIEYDENFPAGLETSFLVKDKKELGLDETDLGKRALLLNEHLRKVYYRDGLDFPWRGGYFNDSTGNSCLWDYGAMFTMQTALCVANPDNATAKEQLKETADLVEKYYIISEQNTIADRSLWQKGRAGNMLSDEFIDSAVKMMNMELINERYYIPVHYYSATVGNNDPYYDDNVWVVMALLDTAGILGEQKYAKRAEECFMYVLSGWTDQAGGGILWKESHATKNTCSNGPAAMTCMKFYNYYKSLTPANAEEENLYKEKQEFYLQFAKYIYEWTKNMLMDSSDGTYYDNIELKSNNDYTLNKAKFTYNSGTMLASSVMLYEVTKDEQYKKDAEKTIKGSYQTFVTRDRLYAEGVDMYPDSDGWFNVYLVHGYLEYARVFGVDAYVKKMTTTMDFAYKNARNYYGLIQNDWSGRNKSIDAHYNQQALRNAAAPIEVIAMLDAWYDEHPSA